MGIKETTKSDPVHGETKSLTFESENSDQSQKAGAVVHKPDKGGKVQGRPRGF
jgi:hypothetical protein